MWHVLGEWIHATAFAVYVGSLISLSFVGGVIFLRRVLESEATAILEQRNEALPSAGNSVSAPPVGPASVASDAWSSSLN